MGLAVLDPMFALPRVQAMLEDEDVYSMTLEAAALLADRSLVPVLEGVAEALTGDDDVAFATLAAEALESCRTERVAESQQWRLPD